MPKQKKLRANYKPRKEKLVEQDGSLFFQLPPEIRTRIYRLTLLHTEPIELAPPLNFSRFSVPATKHERRQIQAIMKLANAQEAGFQSQPWHRNLEMTGEYTSRCGRPAATRGKKPHREATAHGTLPEREIELRYQYSLVDVRKGLGVGLLRTCRQAYHEAVDVFWGGNAFMFTEAGAWVIFLRWVLRIGRAVERLGMVFIKAPWLPDNAVTAAEMFDWPELRLPEVADSLDDWGAFKKVMDVFLTGPCPKSMYIASRDIGGRAPAGPTYDVWRQQYYRCGLRQSDWISIAGLDPNRPVDDDCIKLLALLSDITHLCVLFGSATSLEQAKGFLCDRVSSLDFDESYQVNILTPGSDGIGVLIRVIASSNCPYDFGCHGVDFLNFLEVQETIRDLIYRDTVRGMACEELRTLDRRLSAQFSGCVDDNDGFSIARKQLIASIRGPVNKVTVVCNRCAQVVHIDVRTRPSWDEYEYAKAPRKLAKKKVSRHGKRSKRCGMESDCNDIGHRGFVDIETSDYGPNGTKIFCDHTTAYVSGLFWNGRIDEDGRPYFAPRDKQARRQFLNFSTTRSRIRKCQHCDERFNYYEKM